MQWFLAHSKGVTMIQTKTIEVKKMKYLLVVIITLLVGCSSLTLLERETIQVEQTADAALKSIKDATFNMGPWSDRNPTLRAAWVRSFTLHEYEITECDVLPDGITAFVYYTARIEFNREQVQDAYMEVIRQLITEYLDTQDLDDGEYNWSFLRHLQYEQEKADEMFYEMELLFSKTKHRMELHSVDGVWVVAVVATAIYEPK